MADDRVISVRLRALTADLESGMRRSGAAIRGFQRDADKDMKLLGQSMKSAGRSMTMGLTVPIAAGFAFAIRESVNFESAMAGVAKTMDLSESEFEAMSQGIRDMAMELPASREEIAAVAEAAGQLGIAKENVLSFTRTMIDLGETTNLTADEAATSMAQLANITQMPQDEFDNLGSTLVQLGNNGASTEAEILDLGLRLAGAGSQAGLTEAEILGLASAMADVGINAEMGGTSMSQVINRMRDAAIEGGPRLEAFAETAGVTATEFARMFENDPTAAMTAFVQGLSGITDAGGTMTGVMEGIGLSGERVGDTLRRLSGAGDGMATSFGTATSAFSENRALIEEVAKRYETSGAQMEMAWNQITDAAMIAGDILVPIVAQMAGGIADLAQEFASLPQPVQTLIIGLTGLAAIAGPLLMVAGSLASAWALVGPAVMSAYAATAAMAATNPAMMALAGAAAVAGAALILMGERANEAQEHLDDLTTAGRSLGETLASSGETAFLTEVMSQLIDISPQVVDEMTAAGFAVSDLVDMISSGMSVSAEGELFDQFIERAGVTGDEADHLRERLAEVAYQISIALGAATTGVDAAALEDTRDGVDGLGEAVDAAAQSAQRLEDAWKGLNNSLTDFDAATAAARAALELRDAFAAATEEGGINAEEMLGLRDNLSGLVSAYQTLATEQNTNAAGVTNVRAANRQLRADLGQIAAFIPNELRPQWRQLTRDILRVPDRQQTQATTPGAIEAQGRWRTLDRIIDSVPEHLQTSATAYVEAAIESWNRLRDAINAAATAANTSPAAMGFSGISYGGPRYTGATGLRVRHRAGGVPLLAGEAGYDEVLVTTDPRHRARTFGLLESAGIFSAAPEGRHMQAPAGRGGAPSVAIHLGGVSLVAPGFLGDRRDLEGAFSDLLTRPNSGLVAELRRQIEPAVRGY